MESAGDAWDIKALKKVISEKVGVWIEKMKTEDK